MGRKTGKNVDTEVGIEAASKAQTELIRTPTGYVRRPNHDNDDPNDGRADMLEFVGLSNRSSVYEIKHIYSRNIAVADAKWYQYHLSRDSDFRIYGSWQLGSEYLVEYGNEGKFIGFWPNDFQHVVMAKFYQDGATVYWGKDPFDVDDHSFENVDDYARYLASLAALTGAGVIIGNELGKNRRTPGYAFDLAELLNGSCQPLFSTNISFGLEPATIQISSP